MDYRLQSYLNEWLALREPQDSCDRVALAGGVRELATVMQQVTIAVDLHGIQKVALINHENCGAYGAEAGLQAHRRDLHLARREIHRHFPHLEIELYYLGLDGDFMEIT